MMHHHQTLALMEKKCSEGLGGSESNRLKHTDEQSFDQFHYNRRKKWEAAYSPVQTHGHWVMEVNLS
jgi:hypothetical protein